MTVLKCPSSFRTVRHGQQVWPWCTLPDGHVGSHYAETSSGAFLWADEAAWTPPEHHKGAR